MKTYKDRIRVYGPVPSRRLGFSLGIDIIPFKNCTLDCIYCQLGITPEKTVDRKTFIPAATLLSQIKKVTETGVRIDFITFSGSGEPTLNTDIGKIITEIKKNTDIPVAVLTNGTLLQHEEVRIALMSADLVIPSLDAVTQDVFEAINRPHSSLRITDIIAGIKEFRQKFKGNIWVEVLLVKGVNDSPSHLKKLKVIISDIKPDKVHLNTVVRPPAERHARPLSLAELEKIMNFIGNSCEIIAAFGKMESQDFFNDSWSEIILCMVRRRPMTLADLAASLGLHDREVVKYVQFLLQEGKIRAVRHKNQVYYDSVK